MYYVVWDVSGKLHRSNPMSEDLARAWAEDGNKKWPELKHRVEKACDMDEIQVAIVLKLKHQLSDDDIKIMMAKLKQHLVHVLPPTEMLTIRHAKIVSGI